MCFSNFLWGRLIMVLTPILVHMWGPRTKISIDALLQTDLTREFCFVCGEDSCSQWRTIISKRSLSVFLGAKDFSFAVFSFARGFGQRPKFCRPAAATEASRRKWEKNLRYHKGTLRIRSPSLKNGMDLYNELRLCYRTNPTASDNQNISILKKCICLVF